MTRLFHLTEIRQPEDVKPFLAKPELHWKPGYSACELARSWVGADGIPAPVRAVLDTCPDYKDAHLIEGFFEREVDLRSRGRPSQTDLLAFMHTAAGYAVLAVEGKAEEPFGQLVREWNDGSPGKVRRLTVLCDVLGLDPASVGSLRYQLFHRAASAIFEAERYRCGHALLLVHSFSGRRTSFADFAAFAEALGCPVQVGQVSTPKSCNGVALRLAWVADNVSVAGSGGLLAALPTSPNAT
jgi:hypothetical protein